MPLSRGLWPAAIQTRYDALGMLSRGAAAWLAPCRPPISAQFLRTRVTNWITVRRQYWSWTPPLENWSVCWKQNFLDRCARISSCLNRDSGSLVELALAAIVAVCARTAFGGKPPTWKTQFA